MRGAIMTDGPVRIVVVGGGFAGAYCVRQLERMLRSRDVQITLVNEHNYFVFTPLLIEAATSALEPRHVIIPLRGFLRFARFVMASASRIDFDQRVVTVQPQFGDAQELKFDHLVLALGSVTRTPNVPGVSEFAFGLKTLADASAIRDRAIGMLEMANLAVDHVHRQSWLTFAVVGAGYTGVEAAGEFNDFLSEATRKYPNISRSDIRVILIQKAGRILDSLDRRMSDEAAKVLRQNGIEIHLNESISEIRETSFTLTSGEQVACHTVIWSAGVGPPPLLADLDLPKDSHGYLDCEPDLRVKHHSDIWGVGDCASNTDVDGNRYPPTAQHALR